MDKAVSEGSVGGMRLGFGNVAEKRQTAYPIVDLLLDKLFSELTRAKRSAKVRSPTGGDVNSCVSKDLSRPFSMPLLCNQPSFRCIGKVAIAWPDGGKLIPPGVKGGKATSG